VKSLERMMAILDYFEGSTIEWTMEALHAELGYTRSTLYRYLKVLTDAGLLTSLPDVGYTLGPRIAELDYQMRERDPLINASRPVMTALIEEIPGIALLCRRYRDRVLCVHQEQSTESFQSHYERGLARPLLRGAASRIILAFMPAAMIRKLYEAETEAFAGAGLGATLAEVRAALRTVRQAGWDISAGHVTPGVTGIAAPIFDRRNNVLGSLSLTLGQPSLSPDRARSVADRVMFCAGIVTRAVSHMTG
jgi:DNA-binding IclR family transcriptional regulator